MAFSIIARKSMITFYNKKVLGLLHKTKQQNEKKTYAMADAVCGILTSGISTLGQKN